MTKRYKKCLRILQVRQMMTWDLRIVKLEIVKECVVEIVQV